MIDKRVPRRIQERYACFLQALGQVSVDEVGNQDAPTRQLPELMHQCSNICLLRPLLYFSVIFDPFKLKHCIGHDVSDPHLLRQDPESMASFPLERFDRGSQNPVFFDVVHYFLLFINNEHRLKVNIRWQNSQRLYTFFVCTLIMNAQKICTKSHHCHSH
ncbi:MAG: hypothetical protein U5O39_10130 [Gammaproteobacteria bacterium]|nr:hypothetical protein [Gammaproteobacteria bacterium]